MSRVNKIITCLKWFDEGPDKMYRDFTSSDIMPHVCFIALWLFAQMIFIYSLHTQRIFLSFQNIIESSLNFLAFSVWWMHISSKVVKTYLFLFILILVGSIHPISNYFIDVILSLKRQRISQKSASKAWAFLNLKVQIGYFLGILLTRYSRLFNTITSLIANRNTYTIKIPSFNRQSFTAETFQWTAFRCEHLLSFQQQASRWMEQTFHQKMKCTNS